MLMFQEDFGWFEMFWLWATKEVLTRQEKDFLDLVEANWKHSSASSIFTHVRQHAVSVVREDQYTHRRRISTLGFVLASPIEIIDLAHSRLNYSVVGHTRVNMDGDLVPVRIVLRPSSECGPQVVEVKVYYTFSRREGQNE